MKEPGGGPFPEFLANFLKSFRLTSRSDSPDEHSRARLSFK